MPGYGYSGKPSPTNDGWEPTKIARAWVTLMKRLGYSRFVAQGGDWGAFVTNLMAQQAAPELIAFRNLPTQLMMAAHPQTLVGDLREAFRSLRG